MTSAMQPPNSRQRWASFDEARMILRMSEGTLRREIRAGRIQGEQRRRNPDSPTDQRLIWEVLITDPPETDADSESGQPPPIRQQAPDSERLLNFIDALLRANAESMVQQAEAIAALREERGRLQAERDSAVARANEVAEQLAAERARADAAEARVRDWKWWNPRTW
jgi:hypothetical protein